MINEHHYIETLKAYCETVTNTNEEKPIHKKEAIDILEGKPEVEGRMLSDHLKRPLHIIEFHDRNPVVHMLVTQGGCKKIDAEKVNYDDPILHLGLYRFHFVPVLRHIQPDVILQKTGKEEIEIIEEEEVKPRSMIAPQSY